MQTHSRTHGGPCFFGPMAGESSMTEHWEEHPRRKRRRKRHKRKGKHGSRRDRDDREDAYEEIDDALLSPEERALKNARRAADAKVELAGDALKFGIISLLLLIFLPPVGVIVLIFWGSGYLKQFYRLVIEPRLRERFLEEEVSKQVHAHVVDERRALEGEHARSMQELSARVAHEIRNPITAAKSLVQQMEEEPAAKENVEYARVALEELSRVERSVSHLLRFARDEEMRVSTVRLRDVVESAVETFRDRIARTGIQVTERLDNDGMLQGDPEKLRRVVINLVGNALDALDESATPSPVVDIEIGENLAGTELWLRIADNGPGIDETALEKMFNPFYTSKANGTGLGLPICKKLVDAHGGNIEVASDEEGGAVFLVSFPKWSSLEGDTL